ncbi:MAG: hypothetical protein SFW64_03650 [Alphaproteobacteria bacterium]|nr:hypothetical protein [Alphaproteobacteria bacterium]
MGKENADKTATEAQAWYNSQSVESVTAAMKDNKLLPQDNPVFIATVQHLYGRNSMQSAMDQMQQQVSTGELQFKTPDELRNYAVEQRNKALEPYAGNEYITAGYDKSFNANLDQIAGIWSTKKGQETVANGQAQATMALNTQAQSILNPSNTLSPGESISTWMDQYKLLRNTGVLQDPKQQREALYDNALTFANAGRQDLVDSLMSYQVDNGLNVRALLGNDKAEALLNHSRTVSEQMSRKAQAAAIADTQASAQADITQTITTKLSSGLGASIPPTYTTVGSDGELKLEKTDKLIQMQAQADTQGMDLPQQIQYYSNNSVDNELWSNMLATGVDNLYTVGVSADGKNIGQLSDAGQQAFALFRELRAINPAYAQKIAKGDKTYERLQTMDDLVNIGFARDANEAASLVNGEAKITPQDYANIQTRVAVATDNLTSTFFPWNRNSDQNITALNGQVRRLAQAIMVNGRAKDADEAVQIASDHVKLSALQFNGATYTKDQMPMFPLGDPPEYWMEKYGEKVVDETLKKNPETARMSYTDLFWMPQPGGEFNLIKPGSGQPVVDEHNFPITFRKEDIVKFSRDESAKGTDEHAVEMSYRMFKKRLEGEWNIRNPSSGIITDTSAAFEMARRSSAIPTLDQYKNLRGQKTIYRGQEVPVQTLPLPQLNEWMKKHGSK